MKFNKKYITLFSWGLFLLALGCQQQQAGRPVTIEVWAHQGQEAEVAAMKSIKAGFEQAHSNIQVNLTFFPAAQFTEKISTAAAARGLPDVFEVDGPLVAQFVDAGLLQPVDSIYTPDEMADFLPTIVEQGTINGVFYAPGAFDSAVLIYYDKNLFRQAGVSMPNRNGWTWGEFLSTCEALKQSGVQPIAMHMNESSDEWFTYAFAPVLWSAGGRLISKDGGRVEGVLDTSENIDALEAWNTLFAKGYARKTPIDPDPFGKGDVAMDWNGHWMARSHMQAKGDALGVAPLPALKQKAAPSGSWCWGMASSTKQPDAAAEWLRWVTGPKTGARPMVEANGAVPGRKSAFQYFSEFDQDPYLLFREQIEGWARPRPRTPHYATLTQYFAATLRDVVNGNSPEEQLSKAAESIQNVIGE